MPHAREPSGSTPLSTPDFDLIIVAQSRPGQFAQAEIESWQQRYPLTPVIVVLGSWCEGEMRSGKPLIGVPRLYWHQFSAQYEDFTEQIIAGKPTRWHLPSTSTRSDVLLTLPAANTAPPHPIPSIAIYTRLQTDYEMLSDICRPLAAEINWCSPVPPTCEPVSVANDPLPISLSLINLDHGFGEAFETASKLQAIHPRAPFILLTGFPRQDDLQRFQEDFPRCAVVSKPFEHLELVNTMLRLVKRGL